MKLYKFHKLSHHQTFYVIDANDRRWATNSHWLVPFEDSLAADLLGAFNLGDPGNYYVGRYVTLQGEVTDKVQESVVRLLAPRSSGHVLTLRTLMDRPVLVRGNRWGDKSPYLAVYDRPDDAHTTLNREYLRVIAGEKWTEVAAEQVDGPHSMVRLGESLLMPVRLTTP